MPEESRKRAAYYNLLAAQKSVGKVLGDAVRGDLVSKREQNKIFKCLNAIDILIETYKAWSDCDE